MRTLWGLVLSIAICYASFLVSSEKRVASNILISAIKCHNSMYFWNGTYQYVNCYDKPRHYKCLSQDRPQSKAARLCLFVSRYKAYPAEGKECPITPAVSVLFDLTSRFLDPKAPALNTAQECVHADGATICWCFEPYCNNWENVKTMLTKHWLGIVKREYGREHKAEFFNDVKNYLKVPHIANATFDMDDNTTMSRINCQLGALNSVFPPTPPTTTTSTTTATTTTTIPTTTSTSPTTTTTTPSTTTETTFKPSTSEASTTQETTTITENPTTTTTTEESTQSPTEGTTASSTQSNTESPEETTTEDSSTSTEAGLFDEGQSDGRTEKMKESSAETTTEQSSNIIKESTIEEQGWTVAVKREEKDEVWEENEKCNRTNVMRGDDGYYKVCNVGDSSEQCPHMNPVPRFRTSDDEVLICVSIWHHNSHQERHPKDPRCVPGDTSKPVLEVRPMKMKKAKAQNLMKGCRYSTKSVICSCQDHICENLRNLENFFYEEMGRRPAMESGYNPKVADFPEAKRQVLSFCIYQELVDMTHEPFSLANMKPRKPRSRSVLLIVKGLSVLVIFIVAILIGCIAICNMWKSYTDIAYIHYLNTEQRKKSGSRQKFRRFKERLTKREKTDANGKKTAKPSEKEEMKTLLEEKKAESTKRRKESEEKERESKAKKEEEVDKGKIGKKETEMVKEGKGKQSKEKDGEKKKEKKGEEKGSKKPMKKKESKKEVIKKESKEKKEEKEKGPKVEGTPKKGDKERKVEEPKVENKNKKAKKEKKRRAMTDDDRTMEVSVTGRVQSSSTS